MKQATYQRSPGSRRVAAAFGLLLELKLSSNRHSLREESVAAAFGLLLELKPNKTGYIWAIDIVAAAFGLLLELKRIVQVPYGAGYSCSGGLRAAA